MTPAEITQEESVEKRTENRVLMKPKALNLGREEGSGERTERKQPVRREASGEHGVREPSQERVSRSREQATHQTTEKRGRSTQRKSC